MNQLQCITLADDPLDNGSSIHNFNQNFDYKQHLFAFRYMEVMKQFVQIRFEEKRYFYHHVNLFKHPYLQSNSRTISLLRTSLPCT